MQNVSELYRTITEGSHWFEWRLLVTDSNGVVQTVGMDKLISLDTVDAVFGDKWSIGNAVAAGITVEMIYPTEWSIPRAAMMRPQFRAVNPSQQSEWLPNGVFFVDTRQSYTPLNADEYIIINGYDRMLQAEEDFPTVNWDTAPSIIVLEEICTALGWELESDTEAFFENSSLPDVSTPFYCSCREVIESIAGMHCGNFIMDEQGRLKFIPLLSAPAESYYLITNNDEPITIGGDRIVLQ